MMPLESLLPALGGICLPVLLFSQVLQLLPNFLRFHVFFAYFWITLFIPTLFSTIAYPLFCLYNRNDFIISLLDDDALVVPDSTSHRCQARDRRGGEKGGATLRKALASSW